MSGLIHSAWNHIFPKHASMKTKKNGTSVGHTVSLSDVEALGMLAGEQNNGYSSLCKVPQSSCNLKRPNRAGSEGGLSLFWRCGCNVEDRWFESRCRRCFSPLNITCFFIFVYTIVMHVRVFKPKSGLIQSQNGLIFLQRVQRCSPKKQLLVMPYLSRMPVVAWQNMKCQFEPYWKID